MSKDRENIPIANKLMGSMRSIGYSFESAVADIIDNSISAHCKNVHLFFPMTNSDALAVGILDDGSGLTSDELLEAMRFGSTSEDIRKEDDLGRFGLGMKSASLSQCRVLTVMSRKNGKLSAYRWDYDYILLKKNWFTQELEENEMEKVPYSRHIMNSSRDGTLVVWENFDVIEKASDGQIFDTLKDLKVSVCDHLSLIYHRFLSDKKDGKGKKITISVNNLSLSALDPFLENHPKTTRKKEVEIATRDSCDNERLIKVKAFILPFATDMTKDDWRMAGGIENFRSLQGFYVYRNKRLIIWGTWFGMRLGELTKNARIRVDIPNSLDDIWGIDIMKRKATIPKIILNQLKSKVSEAMETSIRKHTYRGRKDEDSVSHIWNRMQGRNGHFYYKINKENLLYKYVEDRIPPEYHTYINKLIGEIENNLPTQQIYIDSCNNSVVVEEPENWLDDLYQHGLIIIEATKVLGRDVNDLIDQVMKTEPFCRKKELREMFNKYYSNANVK